MTLLKVSGSLVTTPLLFEIVWMIRIWKYAYETCMNQKYTSEKKYVNEKCTNGKKVYESKLYEQKLYEKKKKTLKVYKWKVCELKVLQNEKQPLNVFLIKLNRMCTQTNKRCSSIG